MIYGLTLTLIPTTSATTPPPLAHWLPTPGVLIPLLPEQGVERVFLALAQPAAYGPLVATMMAQILEQGTVVWQERIYQVIGLERELEPLQTLSVLFQANGPLPKDLGRACHALVLDWFNRADPQLSERLHEAAPCPFRLHTRFNGPQQLHLEISLLQGELLGPLLWGLGSQLGEMVTITKVPCFVHGQVKRLRQGRWDLLAARPSQPDLCLRFISPTSFKREGVIQPFPLPELVFSGLLRRWNQLAPEEWQLPTVQWAGRVAAYDLKTAPLYLNGLTEIGALGWVRYQFPDQEQGAIASTLAAFAEFAGVGRKTPWGMGHAVIDPLESSPSVQRKPKKKRNSQPKILKLYG